MSKDILNDYFAQQASRSVEPRSGFKEELIKSLNRRIVRLEQRQRYFSVLWIVLAIVALLCLLVYYLPLDEIKLPTLDISPTYLLLSFTLFTILFVVSYFVNAMQILKLRRELGLLS